MTRRDGGGTDFNPKHRIVGAIIVVALAVIFVPIILNQSEPSPELKQGAETPTQTTLADAPQTKVVIMPVDGRKAEKTAASVAQAAPQPVGTASKTDTENTAPPGAAKAQPKIAAKRRVPEKSSDPAETWMVQVGTFANRQNAARLRDKLRGRGYQVDEETITFEGNKAVRLRIGPFADKPAALKAQAKIQKDAGVQGVLVAHP